MKIIFDSLTPDEIIDQFRSHLSSSGVGDMVDFDLTGDRLTVTIRKLGTSKLEFTRTKAPGQSVWELTGEKIALSHRPLKGEFISRIGKLVREAGGSLVTT